MTNSCAALAERIRGEIQDLDELVRRVLAAWNTLNTANSDASWRLDSVALNLHGFYSGLERIFELLARQLDERVPAGKTWHRDLLRVVAQDCARVRPAVITEASAEVLDEFRRFRHVVRHAYATRLEPAKMQGLVDVLPDLWTQLEADLTAFADFLDLASAPPDEQETQ